MSFDADGIFGQLLGREEIEKHQQKKKAGAGRMGLRKRDVYILIYYILLFDIWGITSDKFLWAIRDSTFENGK